MLNLINRNSLITLKTHSRLQSNLVGNQYIKKRRHNIAIRINDLLFDLLEKLTFEL